MTAEDFDETLAALYHKEPFQVFTVELVGGRQFEVDSPFTFVFRDGKAIYLRPGGIPVWFDHESVSTIHEATRAQIKETDAPDAQQGRRTRTASDAVRSSRKLHGERRDVSLMPVR